MLRLQVSPAEAKNLGKLVRGIVLALVLEAIVLGSIFGMHGC